MWREGERKRNCKDTVAAATGYVNSSEICNKLQWMINNEEIQQQKNTKKKKEKWKQPTT